MQELSIDKVYDILLESKEPLSFKEILNKIGILDATLIDKNDLSQFFTNLGTDGRFCFTEEKKWDLKSRHPLPKYWSFDNDFYSESDEDYDDTEDLHFDDNCVGLDDSSDEEKHIFNKIIDECFENKLIKTNLGEVMEFGQYIDRETNHLPRNDNFYIDDVDQNIIDKEYDEDLDSTQYDDIKFDVRDYDYVDDDEIDIGDTMTLPKIKKLHEIGDESLTAKTPHRLRKQLLASYYTKIVGVTFENRQQLIKYAHDSGLLDVGKKLLIRHNKQNPHDPNCIEICLPMGVCLGYIAKEKASEIVADLQNGFEYVVKSNGVTGLNNSYSLGLNIHVEVYK